MKYLLTLFLSLLSCLLVAQNVIVEHYSKNQGLLNNMVSMTEKDSDGFMWFATWYGLCRFDGEKVLTYNHYQLDHLSSTYKCNFLGADNKQ
jgi:ligand-binding sensor domain-containing protein